MSKGLRNIKDPLEKLNTINRRVREKRGGLGYLAACAAKARIAKHEPAK